MMKTYCKNGLPQTKRWPENYNGPKNEDDPKRRRPQNFKQSQTEDTPQKSRKLLKWRWKQPKQIRLILKWRQTQIWRQLIIDDGTKKLRNLQNKEDPKNGDNLKHEDSPPPPPRPNFPRSPGTIVKITLCPILIKVITTVFLASNFIFEEYLKNDDEPKNEDNQNNEDVAKNVEVKSKEDLKN